MKTKLWLIISLISSVSYADNGKYAFRAEDAKEVSHPGHVSCGITLQDVRDIYGSSTNVTVEGEKEIQIFNPSLIATLPIINHTNSGFHRNVINSELQEGGAKHYLQILVVEPGENTAINWKMTREIPRRDDPRSMQMCESVWTFPATRVKE